MLPALLSLAETALGMPLSAHELSIAPCPLQALTLRAPRIAGTCTPGIAGPCASRNAAPRAPRFLGLRPRRLPYSHRLSL